MTRLAAVAFATAASLFWGPVFWALVISAAVPATAQAPAPGPSAGSCVLIDTDFDIDDMMTIPTVIGARHVAAVVATEGYTVPALGAPAVEHLIDHPGQRAIPVIVGAATERSEGRLEPLFTPAVPGRGSYWLAWPEPRDAYPPLVAFRDWLVGQPAP